MSSRLTLGKGRMTIKDLSQVLAQARTGEWLYVHNQYGTISFKVTNGYWDKFWLCIVDWLYGYPLAQKTHLAVHKVLSQERQDLKKEAAKDLPCFYRSIADIEGYQKAQSQLAKCCLIWNEQFSPTLELNPQEIPSFRQEVSKMKQIYKLLPKKAQEKYSQYQLIKTHVKNFKDSSVSNSSKINSWQAIAKALGECKKTWLDTDGDLDYRGWHYKYQGWNFSSHHHDFDTAGGHKQRLFYIQASLDLTKVFYDWKEQSAIPATELKDWEKARIAFHVNALIKFLQSQAEHQRQPITIEIPHRVDSTDYFFKERFTNFASDLIEALQEAMKKHRASFVHQAGLFSDVSGVENDDPHRCYSRIKCQLLENEQYLPPPYLRPELKWLLPKLGIGYPNPDTIAKMQKCQMQLIELKETHDFVVRFRGKERGCNKSVLLEAFPFLKAREDNKASFREYDPNLLNLDGLIGDVPPEHEDWILTSLLDFAYARQHPILPTQSKLSAKKALKIYFALLSYLGQSA
jgi:hypothetical protein